MGSQPSESDDHPEWLRKAKRWGAAIGVLVAVGSGVGTVYKTISYIDSLRTTIENNKTEVAALRAQIDADHEETGNQLDALVEAVRMQRDRDQEVITNLRIAVAALQATNNLPVRTRSASQSDERARQVRTGAEALRRVESIQDSAEDPLAGL